MKRFIGIDPGANGSIAMIPEEGEIELCPLDKDLLRIRCNLWCMDECFCILEHVTSSPQMGVASAFSFGENFGFIQGMLEAFYMPYELVKPQKWKKAMSCLLGRDATPKQKKERDLEVAKRLFPQVSFRRTPRCKTDWYDAADAILLAEYGRRLYK